MRVLPAREYKSHRRIRHRSRVYVGGDNYTNTIEGFFGLFKNGVRGFYHATSAEYLQNYADEYALLYNGRNSDQPMFWAILNRVQKTAAPAFFLVWLEVAFPRSRRKSASVWPGSCFTSRCGGVGGVLLWRSGPLGG